MGVWFNEWLCVCWSMSWWVIGCGWLRLGRLKLKRKWVWKGCEVIVYRFEFGWFNYV